MNGHGITSLKNFEMAIALNCDSGNTGFSFWMAVIQDRRDITITFENLFDLKIKRLFRFVGHFYHQIAFRVEFRRNEFFWKL